MSASEAHLWTQILNRNREPGCAAALSVMVLGALFLATAECAQASEPMKATAPEKMMPSDQAKSMRACERRAIQQGIKMEERSSFVANCMAKNARPD